MSTSDVDRIFSQLRPPFGTKDGERSRLKRVLKKTLDSLHRWPTEAEISSLAEALQAYAKKCKPCKGRRSIHAATEVVRKYASPLWRNFCKCQKHWMKRIDSRKDPDMARIIRLMGGESVTAKKANQFYGHLLSIRTSENQLKACAKVKWQEFENVLFPLNSPRTYETGECRARAAEVDREWLLWLYEAVFPSQPVRRLLEDLEASGRRDKRSPSARRASKTEQDRIRQRKYRFLRKAEKFHALNV